MALARCLLPRAASLPPNPTNHPSPLRHSNPLPSTRRNTTGTPGRSLQSTMGRTRIHCRSTTRTKSRDRVSLPRWRAVGRLGEGRGDNWPRVSYDRTNTCMVLCDTPDVAAMWMVMLMSWTWTTPILSILNFPFLLAVLSCTSTDLIRYVTYDGQFSGTCCTAKNE